MMNKLPVLLIFILLGFGCSKEDDPTPLPPEEEENGIPIVEGSSITFASLEEASTLLKTSDPYTKALSKFDIASRTGNPANDQEQQYLDFASSQAQEWSESEILNLKSTITSIKTKIENMGLKVDLPEEIKLVKSTMKEEGNSTSYTRNEYIVVKGNISEGDMIHELFHLFSRKSPSKRDALYKTINFNKSNLISYPASISDMIITNPDAPFIEHTINLTINGQPEEAVLILMSDEAYQGSSFFGYIKQRLMLVEGGADNKTAKLVNGQPVLKELTDASDLYQKIGTNTDYTYHPEEILADHFSLLVRVQGVPDPEFLDAMKAILVQ